MTIPALFLSPTPPSLTDDPIGFGWSLAGMMIVTIIFARWAQEMTWKQIDDWRGWRDPRTWWRWFVLSVSVSGVVRNGPDVLSLAFWHWHTPAMRFEFAHWNRMLDGFSSPLQVFALVIGYYGNDVWEQQLGKEPIPMELYAKWRPLGTFTGIVLLCCAISFAIAFEV